MFEATQVAQDTQAGYACDYCTKPQPVAFNEVKACCKGHHTLAEQSRRTGKRHATRIMSDAYGNGIVRGQVENANLRAHAQNHDVTAAGSIKTCATVSFLGRNYVETVQRLNDRYTPGTYTVFAEVDIRTKRHRGITFRDVATSYGKRPCVDRVWYASPYEFVADWDVAVLNYPLSFVDRDTLRHHAELTPAGVAKLRADRRYNHDNDLIPGMADCVKEEGGVYWMPYPDLPSAAHFRYTWVIVSCVRPVAPMFVGAPVPQKRDDATERSALLAMACFHPWTLRHGDADDTHVPFVGCLRSTHASWEDALTSRLGGNAVSRESARYGSNALSVYLVRPRDPNEAARSDDVFGDEELILEQADLEEALNTIIGGRDGETRSTTNTYCRWQSSA